MLPVAGWAQTMQNKAFTHADTLRGSLLAERTWWDVQRYDITVRPDFVFKTTKGTNLITYKVVGVQQPAMQLDLQEPLQIDSILYDGQRRLSFTKEENAWHVKTVPQVKGSTHVIEVYFSGKAHESTRPPWSGGWTFAKDSLDRPWMTVTCQGLGASIWYPCKDHQSDEPDKGASLTMVAPDSLVAVANGRLQFRKSNGDGTTSWKWAVVNPISNYCLIPYIGKYVNFHEDFKGEKGHLDLDYWVLDYNLPRAKDYMPDQVHNMLRSMEYWLGPYPFYEDGYKLIDVQHTGMEHQSAVAYGNHYAYGYRGRDGSGTGWGKRWDFIIIHESGHEWFGNNITTKDLADMYVHEGYTNYSETLFIDYMWGKDAANEYNAGIRRGIRNDRPIVAKYNVNDMGSGDMYPKAGNMLHAIRHSVDNDSLFRQILRGMNKTFYHQTVTTGQIEKYFSRQAGFDYGKVFDQYLRTTQIPELEYYFSEDRKKVFYHWVNCVPGFNLPLAFRNKNARLKIYPTGSWKNISLQAGEVGLFDPDSIRKMYYIGVRPAPRAMAFDLKDVRLLDGPFKEAMEADTRFLLVLEPDRLLSEFRAHSGLEPKAKKYGGWESSGLAGHSLGHYLSACSMAYAASGDERYRQRVNYIVDELMLCQQARRTGYIGAIPREDSLWMEVAEGKIRSRGFDLNGAWSPWYTVHKVMAGLLDAFQYCNNAKALQIERGMADWTKTIVGGLSDSLLQKMLACEYGGMNEVLVNTYAVTGEQRYLDLSYKFHDRRILDSLSMGLDDLPGKHSNTQIPKVIGCARRYELTGDERDRTIAGFFWKTVVNDHSYATGGNSNYEYLGEARKLNDLLTDNTTETCNTYNMLKLTRHLFEWEPDAGLMDYYEKALYNHILSSQDHETGMMCYFVPLRMGTRKEYSDTLNTFTCCVGSGMENHVKYGESIYFKGRDGSLFVNLFIPSRLQWNEKGVTIEQQTLLPDNDKVTLTISTAKPVTFTLRIRKPAWVAHQMHISVNGQPLKADTLGVDGYVFFTRQWADKDKVTIQMPENFHSEPMPDNADRVALFYGPVLLAGLFGDKEPDPVKGVPVIVTSEKDPNQWIKRDGLVFHTKGVGQPVDVELVPFNRTKNEYYSVYWDRFTPEGWVMRQDQYREDKKKQQELEDRTIDRLRLGEMQPERDHTFTGEELETGEEHGQKWRSTGQGGNFSFVMKVDQAAGNTIVCSYWGSDHRGRIFNIQVDGQTIATQDLNGFKESRFYEIRYDIPQELVKGKTTVTVKFSARASNNAVGPVYGTIRMVKAD